MDPFADAIRPDAKNVTDDVIENGVPVEGVTPGDLRVASAGAAKGKSVFGEAMLRLRTSDLAGLAAGVNRYASLMTVPGITSDQAWDAVTVGATDDEVAEWLASGWPDDTTIATLRGLRQIRPGGSEVQIVAVRDKGTRARFAGGADTAG